MHLAHPPVQPAVGDVTPGFLQLAPGVLQDAADRAIAGGSQCVADARDQLPQARLPGVASGRELATRCSTLTATAWERGQRGHATGLTACDLRTVARDRQRAASTAASPG